MKSVLLLFMITITGCKTKSVTVTKEKLSCNKELFSSVIKKLIVNHIKGQNLNCTLEGYSYETDFGSLVAYLDLDSYFSNAFVKMYQHQDSSIEKCSMKFLVPCMDGEKTNKKSMHYLSTPLVSENKDMVVFEDFIVHGFNWSENILVVYFYKNKKWSKQTLPL